MCDDIRHCGQCGFFIPICKAEAESVCAALPRTGQWQRYRDEVIVAVGYALKNHGICSYHTELQDRMGIACDEWWRRNVDTDD